MMATSMVRIAALLHDIGSAGCAGARHGEADILSVTEMQLDAPTSVALAVGAVVLGVAGFEEVRVLDLPRPRTTGREGLSGDAHRRRDPAGVRAFSPSPTSMQRDGRATAPRRPLDEEAKKILLNPQARSWTRLAQTFGGCLTAVSVFGSNCSLDAARVLLATGRLNRSSACTNSGFPEPGTLASTPAITFVACLGERLWVAASMALYFRDPVWTLLMVVGGIGTAVALAICALAVSATSRTFSATQNGNTLRFSVRVFGALFVIAAYLVSYLISIVFAFHTSDADGDGAAARAGGSHGHHQRRRRWRVRHRSGRGSTEAIRRLRAARSY